jgi:ribonuclease R
MNTGRSTRKDPPVPAAPRDGGRRPARPGEPRRTGAETGRTGAETGRTGAETGRTGAETGRERGGQRGGQRGGERGGERGSQPAGERGSPRGGQRSGERSGGTGQRSGQSGGERSRERTGQRGGQRGGERSGERERAKPAPAPGARSSPAGDGRKPAEDLKPAITSLLARRDYVPADATEILGRLRLTQRRRAELEHALAELEQAGRVVRVKGDRYAAALDADLVPGRIRMNRQGKGFLIPDDSGLKEIVVPESATGTALHEDRVLVRRDVPPTGLRAAGDPPNTGAVVRVLARRRTQIVGTLVRSQRFLTVVPDDPRIPHEIYVSAPRGGARAPRVGDKVVVALREWKDRSTNPEGDVLEVLGAPDAQGVDMLSVLRQYDLGSDFPRKVLQEARAVGAEVRARDLAGREDRRGDRVITIDPDDAKDFDDAIALERVSAEQWKLQVHIADVSHYVRPGTELDEEARRRGNSTYLVDRVVPMLPEELSNGLCSLKPAVDRLTKCAEFLLGQDGRVLKTRFFPAVIHSQRRFTYREAFEVLQRRPRAALEEMLHDAHALAQRIRARRFKAGALELDTPEIKIRLDARGVVERIERIENDASHQLIEEFMLLANEAVAVRLRELRRPAVYRVHEEPDPRRLNEYREEVLGHRVRCGDLRERPAVQELLKHLGTLTIGPALKIGFLKALMRARYAVEPLGHYGLAKRDYTHFTSPIRRYADLLVHRALFERQAARDGWLHETAEHISNTERNSADAERDSKDLKLYALLEGELGARAPRAYSALVTDVRNFGFFVDVPDLGMSGLVPLSLLGDDFYVFEPARGQLLGRRTRRVIRLGDRLLVQIARVNRFKKQVDFRLAEERGPRARPAPEKRSAGTRRPEGRRPAQEKRPVENKRQTEGRRPAEGKRPPERPAPRPAERERPAEAPAEGQGAGRKKRSRRRRR